MLRVPLLSCLSEGTNSSLNLPPQMDEPPRPVPVGSPPWIMKPLMIRWKITLSYLPVAARVAKFSQVWEHVSCYWYWRSAMSLKLTLGVWSLNRAMVISPRVVWRVTPSALAPFPLEGTELEDEAVLEGAAELLSCLPPNIDLSLSIIAVEM